MRNNTLVTLFIILCSLQILKARGIEGEHVRLPKIDHNLRLALGYTSCRGGMLVDDNVHYARAKLIMFENGKEVDCWTVGWYRPEKKNANKVLDIDLLLKPDLNEEGHLFLKEAMVGFSGGVRRLPVKAVPPFVLKGSWIDVEDRTGIIGYYEDYAVCQILSSAKRRTPQDGEFEKVPFRASEPVLLRILSRDEVMLFAIETGGKEDVISHDQELKERLEKIE